MIIYDGFDMFKNNNGCCDRKDRRNRVVGICRNLNIGIGFEDEDEWYIGFGMILE